MEGRYHDFTLAEAMEIAKRNDPGEKVPSVSRTLIAEIERLRKLVRTAITDYIQPEIRAEEEAFRGHENCSNLAGLRLDLAEFQAAVNGANDGGNPRERSAAK